MGASEEQFKDEKLIKKHPPPLRFQSCLPLHWFLTVAPASAWIYLACSQINILVKLVMMNKRFQWGWHRVWTQIRPDFILGW